MATRVLLGIGWAAALYMGVPASIAAHHSFGVAFDASKTVTVTGVIASIEAATPTRV